jgi:putative hydroxymethylpyrimidine transport system permease protein
MGIMKVKWPGMVFILGFLVLWQIGATMIDASYILPSVTNIFRKLWEIKYDIFVINFWPTMQVALIGSAIAIIIGIFLAIVMDFSKGAERALYPLLNISQTIPSICLAPLFIVWFGFNPISRILLIVLSTFFSIAVELFDGFRSANREIVELLKTYGAEKFEIFFKLKIQTALPNFFSALKISLPWAIVAAVVSERLGAPSGLGVMIFLFMERLNASGTFAVIVVISALCLLTTKLLRIIEKKLISWNVELY